MRPGVFVPSLAKFRLRECWNTGKLEKWVLTSGTERILDSWVNGNIRFDDKKWIISL
jgi:hypothetical protein